jgi:putative SOS response-associated peptidase YedK
MCGRYSLVESGEEIAARFLLAPASLPPLPLPWYNISPGSAVLTVVRGPAGRGARLARWGFRPAWSRPPRPAPINARLETAPESRLFGPALRARRCLLPASGFYEWRAAGGRREPVRFAPAGGGLWALAGIWDERPPEGGDPGATVAILTTAPNELVAPVHDRMPVILRPEWEAAWLEPGPPAPDLLAAAAAPYPAGDMVAHRVSPAVNNPRHQGPDCVTPLP